MSPESKFDDILAAGNKFALAFALLFAFVYFVIIEPHFSRDRAPEMHIDRTLSEIILAERLQKERQSDIRYLRQQELERLHKRRAEHEAWEQAEAKALEGEAVVHEKMIQLGVAYQALSKAKLENKQYSIPLVSVSIDEETLLKFFPILCALGLIRIFFYRLALLRAVPIGTVASLPVWSAPVPFGRTVFWKWIGINFAGLVSFGSIVFMTLRFLLMYARENPPSLFLAAGDTFLLVLLVLVFITIVFLAFLGVPEIQAPSKDVLFE